MFSFEYSSVFFLQANNLYMFAIEKVPFELCFINWWIHRVLFICCPPLQSPLLLSSPVP